MHRRKQQRAATRSQAIIAVMDSAPHLTQDEARAELDAMTQRLADLFIGTTREMERRLLYGDSNSNEQWHGFGPLWLSEGRARVV